MKLYSPTTNLPCSWLYWPVFAMTIMLMSCSANGPECSDTQVIAKVKDLVWQTLNQNYQFAAVYDLKASHSDLRAIRTISSDKRHCMCRGDLALELELSPELKAAVAKKPPNDPEGQMMNAMFGDRSRQADLRYSVERTDDGKDLYVTIQQF